MNDNMNPHQCCMFQQAINGGHKYTWVVRSKNVIREYPQCRLRCIKRRMAAYNTVKENDTSLTINDIADSVGWWEDTGLSHYTM
jgi:hypothetical protein